MALFFSVARRLAPTAFNKKGDIKALGEGKAFKKEETPGLGISILASILPVVLMIVATLAQAVKQITIFNESVFLQFIEFCGQPSIGVLILIVMAIYTMGVQ